MACIPYSVVLFYDVVWYFSSAILVLSDVVFDVLTCVRYYKEGWLTPFILAIVFLVLPAVLIGVADFYEIDIIAIGDDEEGIKKWKQSRVKRKNSKAREEDRAAHTCETERESRRLSEGESLLLQVQTSSPRYQRDSVPSGLPCSCTSKATLNSVDAERIDIASSGPKDRQTVGNSRRGDRNGTGNAEDLEFYQNESRASNIIVPDVPDKSAGRISPDGYGCDRQPSEIRDQDGIDDRNDGRPFEYYRSTQFDEISKTMDAQNVYDKTCNASASASETVQISNINEHEKCSETICNSNEEGKKDTEKTVEMAADETPRVETTNQNGTSKSTEKCQFVLCNYSVQLVINIIMMQLAVICRRFVLAYKFGKRWYQYVCNDEDKREFQRESERPVAMGKVAYDLAEDKFQENYLALKYEDESLFRLWIIESFTESLPQLLINLYVLVKYQNNAYVQSISAILSFLTLVWGVTSPEKYFRGIQVIFEGRDPNTRTDALQIFFIFMYKGFLLAARSLAFVYFTIAFQFYIIIVIAVHWMILFGRLLYYKLYRGILKDIRYLRLVTNSISCIFLYFHVSNKKRIRFDMLLYYILFVVENIVLVLSWYCTGKTVDEYFDSLVMIVVVGFTLLGVFIMVMYYAIIHKSHAYIVDSHPLLTVFQCCLRPYVHRKPKDVIVCKNLPTRRNCYVYKNDEQTLIPVAQDHVYVDQRLTPLEGYSFYFSDDTVFCARPGDIHERGNSTVRGSDDEWIEISNTSDQKRLVRKTDCFYDFIDNRGKEVHIALSNFSWDRPRTIVRNEGYLALSEKH